MQKIEELRNELELAMKAAKESMREVGPPPPPVINIYNSEVSIYPPPREPPQERR